MFLSFIALDVNKCINEGTYVDAVKKSEIRQLYKKAGKAEKSNYSHISVYSNVSKIYEKYLYHQIHCYFDKILSRCQCGFRKGISSQHTLLTMIEKIKILRENKQFYAAILTDLSKVFDCIPCDLLIAKLNAYDFDQEALNLILDYLCDISQKVKVGF